LDNSGRCICTHSDRASPLEPNNLLSGTKRFLRTCADPLWLRPLASNSVSGLFRHSPTYLPPLGVFLLLTAFCNEYPKPGHCSLSNGQGHCYIRKVRWCDSANRSMGSRSVKGNVFPLPMRIYELHITLFPLFESCCPLDMHVSDLQSAIADLSETRFTSRSGHCPGNEPRTLYGHGGACIRRSP
jgi:hypothetical protein